MRQTRILVVAGLVLVAAGVLGAQGIEPEGSGGAAGAWTPGLPCEGLFSDVPCGSQFDVWVEQFSRDGITTGCATGKYCPENPVTRRQMAVFVERAMRGGSGWPPNTMLVHAVHNTSGSPNDTASGAALLAAMAAIPASGNNVPSATNPWLVLVGPGDFDLGTGSLAMKEYVTLRGAGVAATIVRNQTTGSAAAAVRATDGCAVQDLTVRNDGPGVFPVALSATGPNVLIQDVLVLIGGATSAYAVGILGNQADQLALVNVEVRWTSGVTWGIVIDSSSNLRMRDVQVMTNATGSSSARGLVLTSSLWGQFDHCRFETGGVDNSYGVGVHATASNFTLTDSHVEGNTHGSLTGYGLSLNDSSTVTATRTSILGNRLTGASGVTEGIYCDDCSVSLVNSQVDASFIGIYALNASAARTVKALHSRISGDTGYISATNYSASFQFTQFVGGGVITTYGGSATCAAVTSPSAFFSSGCP
jgi:hypothetical protein